MAIRIKDQDNDMILLRLEDFVSLTEKSPQLLSVSKSQEKRYIASIPELFRK